MKHPVCRPAKVVAWHFSEDAVAHFWRISPLLSVSDVHVFAGVCGCICAALWGYAWPVDGRHLWGGRPRRAALVRQDGVVHELGFRIGRRKGCGPIVQGMASGEKVIWPSKLISRDGHPKASARPPSAVPSECGCWSCGERHPAAA